MSNRLISKSVICDNITLFIPREIKSDNLVLLSHGSSGPGESEQQIAEFFLANGYQVGLVDYFSPHNIDSLGWIDFGPYADTYTASFREIFDIKWPENQKIIHIGFSLGGYVGLLNAEKFTKNYCFYPGIVAVTQQLIDKDYTNTTVVLPEYDDWCDNYQKFNSMCKNPPKTSVAHGCYHGFMLPDKDREILITKYNTTERVLSSQEFNDLQFHYDVLTQAFPDKINQKIRLRSNKKYSIIYLNQILQEIQDL